MATTHPNDGQRIARLRCVLRPHDHGVRICDRRLAVAGRLPGVR